MKPIVIIFIAILVACSGESKIKEDELYSRHLQRKVQLTILNTPIPSDKSTLNLLILNDGQDMKLMRVKEIMDSLYKEKEIEPLVIVGIHAGDRMQEFGISGKPDYQQRGSKADHYNSFVDKELFEFIKKNTGVRKFKSVVVAGWSLGALSAFDIAWNNTDKIDAAGLFSGSFWWRDKDAADSTYSDARNRIAIEKVKAARRKPTQEFWFYAGNKEENGDRDKDGIIDAVDDVQDLRGALISKKLINETESPIIIDPQGLHDQASWSRHFGEFLVWAFQK